MDRERCAYRSHCHYDLIGRYTDCPLADFDAMIGPTDHETWLQQTAVVINMDAFRLGIKSKGKGR